MPTIIFYGKREGSWQSLGTKYDVDWDFPHYQFSFNDNKDHENFQEYYDKAMTFIEDGYTPYRVENTKHSSMK